jgi:hypothetical protein
LTSARVRDSGNGKLHIEGSLEAAGKVETVAFDAEAKPAGPGLRLDAMAAVDRERLGRSADRLAAFYRPRFTSRRASAADVGEWRGGGARVRGIRAGDRWIHRWRCSAAA